MTQGDAKLPIGFRGQAGKTERQTAHALDHTLGFRGQAGKVLLPRLVYLAA
ncbi:MAG TPA: hypothetical protein PLL20_13915 [Phycisphaerae bacterium]|nr:hypothetical protein [Phycisphaerae bacterium]